MNGHAEIVDIVLVIKFPGFVHSDWLHCHSLLCYTTSAIKKFNGLAGDINKQFPYFSTLSDYEDTRISRPKPFMNFYPS
jgi:hypothetical protein